jgi:plastocyanin
VRLGTVAPAVALVALLLAGCGGGDDGETKADSAPAATTNQQEAVPAVVKVSIGDNFYKPKDLTIKRGQSISWRNQGAVAHTVTSDGDSAVKFDSGTVNPGGVYALKPGTAGKLTYHCTIHGKVQSGTITVERG